jgi:tRNA-specific 2-thiouridylase
MSVLNNNSKTTEKALIAMSGGVDSSVAAKLIIDRGIDCEGCIMVLNGSDGPLSAPEGVSSARAVADRLGMNLHVMDFRDEFKSCVIEPFMEEYFMGHTPNPCIACNKHLKFGRLYEEAEKLGCDYIVTGHYARIEKTGDKYLLKKAKDPMKDQSYVLYNLTQEQLAHTLFPLGEYDKPEIRAIAAENGFVNANQKDSQDICFIPDGKYASFIENYTGKTCPRGDYADLDGNVIGKHKGVIYYTVGQHKKLGMSFPQPMYVCKIDPQNNVITLGSNEDLFTREVSHVGDFNWISGEIPSEPMRCKAKIRYRQVEQWATVTPTGENSVKILFDEPQRAITPGQSAVLYDGDVILGGGKIY